MPAGSFVGQDPQAGYLHRGVDAGLLEFGYLNPAPGTSRASRSTSSDQVAAAIFGAAKGHVRLVALTVPQRLPFVEQGQVDIVVDAITITCSRSTLADFSAVYYDAKQQRAACPRIRRLDSIQATSPASRSARARLRRRSR